MPEKKYELTDETKLKIVKGKEHTLHRIKALKDFGDVKKGDLGGFIEKEDNLSHKGNCWVYGNACVFEGAEVCEEAVIYGNAIVYGNAFVWGCAEITDNAKVYGKAVVGGCASVYGRVHIYGKAEVIGRAEISEGKISSGTIDGSRKSIELD